MIISQNFEQVTLQIIANQFLVYSRDPRPIYRQHRRISRQNYNIARIGICSVCQSFLTFLNNLFDFMTETNNHLSILEQRPQMPKVKIHLRTPKGGWVPPPPPGFWSSRPNFSKIFLMGMFSGSRNPTVIMKKFYLYCMTLKIKVKHLFA